MVQRAGGGERAASGAGLDRVGESSVSTKLLQNHPASQELNHKQYHICIFIFYLNMLIRTVEPAARGTKKCL